MTQTHKISQTAAKDFLQSLDGILSKADMKTLAFSLSANTGTIDIERMKKKEEELTITRLLESSQNFKRSLKIVKRSPIYY